jgi:hypothetical protein
VFRTPFFVHFNVVISWKSRTVREDFEVSRLVALLARISAPLHPFPLSFLFLVSSFCCRLSSWLLLSIILDLFPDIRCYLTVYLVVCLMVGWLGSYWTLTAGWVVTGH